MRARVAKKILKEWERFQNPLVLLGVVPFERRYTADQYVQAIRYVKRRRRNAHRRHRVRTGECSCLQKIKASGMWILDPDGEQVRPRSFYHWEHFMRHSGQTPPTRRHAGFTKVTEDARISTVFLGIEHPGGIWETQFFGDGVPADMEDYQRRYETRKEAEEGHMEAIALLTNAVHMSAQRWEIDDRVGQA